MLKGLLLVMLILSSTIQLSSAFPSVFQNKQGDQLIERLDIYQIYNETIFLLNITYYNNTDILNLGNNLNVINEYTILISNLTLNDRSLRWFVSEYNPMSINSSILAEKGFLISFSYNDKSLVNLDSLSALLSDFFRSKFILLNSTPKNAIFISAGNYTSFLKVVLNKIDYKYGGLFNITSRAFPQALIYQFNKEGLRKLILIHSTALATSPQISSSTTFLIDYSRFLSNLTNSPLSSLSLINLNLFGISVLNSTPSLNFTTGYTTHWITKSSYLLTKKIDKFAVTASALNPFIIVMQRVSPAVFNSTSNLTITVFNIGSFNATEVKVKIFLPDWLTSNNDTLIFKNVSSSKQEKSITITAKENAQQGVHEIPAPIAYYKYGSTNFTTIGNTVLVGFKVKRFASLSFYVAPSSSALPDVLSRLSDFFVYVKNNGNSNATKIRLSIDYLDQPILNITAGKENTFPFTLDPSSYKSIPKGADVFTFATLKYTNGSSSYEVKIPASSLFTFGSAFPFINYLSIKPKQYQNSLDLRNYYFHWDSYVLGSTRSSTIKVYFNILSEQGLVYAGKDSFAKKEKYATVTYSYPRGYEHVISLSLNITAYNNFIVPAFQIVEPLNKTFLVSPIVFTSSLVIEKVTNSTILSVSQSIKVEVKAVNKGKDKLYDVHLIDSVPKGWAYISGENASFVSLLNPGESIGFSYIMQAKSPNFPSLTRANATFNFFGFSFFSSSKIITLKIQSLISFNVVKWNYLPLDTGTVELFSNNGTLIANLTIENGKAVWKGYIDTFVVKVYFYGGVVYSESITVTAMNNTFLLRTNVIDLKLRVVDLFNLQVYNAKVRIIGNVTRDAIYENGYYFLSGLIPGVYYLEIRTGSYELKIPIVISNSTRESIEIGLPLIIVAGFTIHVTYLIGAILLIFIISLGYYYVQRRIKRS